MRPLLVVPGLFQTAIYDDPRSDHVWGRLRNLYGGPPIATSTGCAGGRGDTARDSIIPELYSTTT